MGLHEAPSVEGLCYRWNPYKKGALWSPYRLHYEGFGKLLGAFLWLGQQYTNWGIVCSYYSYNLIWVFILGYALRHFGNLYLYYNSVVTNERIQQTVLSQYPQNYQNNAHISRYNLYMWRKISVLNRVRTFNRTTQVHERLNFLCNICAYRETAIDCNRVINMHTAGNPRMMILVNIFDDDKEKQTD